jgi:aminoglycoside phosphotransferase (APT) family kinase protein
VVELVLRVSNPHPFWRGRKTEHEIAVMEFVRAHGRPDVLPVPRVIASSSDAAQWPLGAEFVLMEKVSGQNLRDVQHFATPIELCTTSTGRIGLTTKFCVYAAVAHS